MAAAVLAATPAAAQTVPQQAVPQTREEIERRPPPSSELPQAKLTVEGGIERAPCALDRPDYANIRFTPTEVMFEDLRGLPADALRESYEPYLGREQPVSVVCEIRDRAATILRNAGYIASVEVPEQRIAEGRLRFRVLMAKLVEVRVRGNATGAEGLIASYLDRLTHDEVFNRFAAERYLLLAGDLPGYSVRLSLRSAGRARGEVVGEVTVLRTPVLIDANIQNLGSHQLGRWGAMARAQFFGLTGLGDRTSISAFTTLDTHEQQTVQLAHDFRVGSEGLTLGGQFTYAWAHPDLGDDRLRISARTAFGTLEASYPFIRSQAETLRGFAGLDIVNQRVHFNGLPLSRDRLRVAYLRLAGEAIDTDFSNRLYNIVEPRWRLNGSLELRRGLDIFGASDDCRDHVSACLTGGAVPPSRLFADPTATVLRGTAGGEFRPVPRVTLAVQGRAQYTRDPLLSFEQFSAGNYTIGRGYDPGTLLGDRGVGVQGELRFGSLLPRGQARIAAEPYLFVDQAWAWTKNGLSGAVSHDELTSVGGGLRANVDNQFQLDATLAVPLDRLGADDRRDVRFLLSFTTRLWPWSSK